MLSKFFNQALFPQSDGLELQREREHAAGWPFVLFYFVGGVMGSNVSSAGEIFFIIDCRLFPL